MNISQTNTRVPPHNLQAEKSVLGAMLLDNDAIQKISNILEEEDFYKLPHQIIYREMLIVVQTNNLVDQISMVKHLNQVEMLNKCGGASYIALLTDDIPSIANADYYAKLVKDDAVLRRLISLSNTLMTNSYEPQPNIEELLGQAKTDVMDLSKRMFKTDGFTHIRDVMGVTFNRIDEYHKNPESLRGVPSGFDSLDKMISGFHNSDLIIIAARPSIGKTALALSMAARMTSKHSKSVAFFSLEMSRGQLALRILCSEARVDASLVRKGKLPSQLWVRMTEAVSRLTDAKLYLNDESNLTIYELKARAKSLKQLMNVELIIVDYLQLLSGGKKHESRQQEISHISRHLKILAKDLDIPVIALSQLSRAVEQRGGDGRPVLSDLRESGAIEQDADIVIFINRPEKYGILDEDGNSQEGIAELIIAKHRNGPTGIARVGFIERFASFENLVMRES